MEKFKLRFKRKLQDKTGSEAVTFLLNTAMLIAIFITLITAFVYISQSYHANYICREVVRYIEVTGEYDTSEIQDLIEDLAGDDLNIKSINVAANFIDGTKIQLRNSFYVSMTASYDIVIVQIGGASQSIELPILVSLKGMSEVYYK